MEKHHAGDLINQKYIVLGVMNRRALIAKSIRADATEPFVVWHLDSQDTPYSGIYTADRRVALREFVGLCRGYRCFPKADAERECKEAGLEVLSEEQFYEILESFSQDDATEFLPEALADGGNPVDQLVEWLMEGLLGEEPITTSSRQTA